MADQYKGFTVICGQNISWILRPQHSIWHTDDFITKLNIFFYFLVIFLHYTVYNETIFKASSSISNI